MGSNLSLKQSPSKLNPNDKKSIAKPENIAGQGESNRKFLPSERDKPNDGIGGCAPKPRNESEASTKIAAESNRLDWTSITDVMFGKIWYTIILKSEAPIDIALSTYSVWQITSAGPRISLEKIGV